MMKKRKYFNDELSQLSGVGTNPTGGQGENESGEKGERNIKTKIVFFNI